MNKTIAICLFVSGGLGLTASAAPGDQLHHLLPTAGYDALQFGNTVGIHNDLAVIGGLGLFTTPVLGSAYLFDANTGAQLAEFPPPPEDSRVFGVGIGGPILAAGGGPVAVIGTDRIEPCQCYRPLVRVFDLTDTQNPALLWTIIPDDADHDDSFGSAIAVDGSVALIGAAADNVSGALAGSAYLFDLETGDQLANLIASDGESLDQFGFSVDLDGGMAVIGARWESETASRAGAAYVFDVSDPANPVQKSKLLAADGDVQDYFGYSVAISGNTVVVGSIFNDENGFAAGAAYVFDITDPANPAMTAKIMPADGGDTDDFGWAVDMDGTDAIITARTDNHTGPGAGSAYLYDLSDPASPSLITKILPDPPTNNAVFGWSAAMDSGRAIVGSPQSNDPVSNSGSAFLFDVSTGPQPCNQADLAEPVGLLDLADVLAFIGAFTTLDPAADFDGNGLFDLADITSFVNAFLAGCP